MGRYRRIPARRVRVRSSRAAMAGFEVLENRDLLATLTVGTGGTFPTIQQAVNQARSGDTVEIANGDFAESVDLSLMGSAIGRQPGNLRIRGGGPGVVITSPGGPAIFNSAPFQGDLTLDRLTLESPLVTAAPDSGLQLDGYTGKLDVSNLLVRATTDTGVRLANASGTFSIRDSEVNNAGDGAGDHGLHLSQVTGVLLISDNSLRDVSDEGIVITLSGNGELIASVVDNAVGGDPIAFATTNRGVRIEVSGTARVDVNASNNSLDDLDDTALQLTVSGSAQVQARLDRNIIFNADEGNMVAIRAQDTSRLAFTFDDNTLSDSHSDGVRVSMGGSAKVNAHLRNNLFFNIGDGAGDDALTITADSNSSATLNAFLNFNDFVTIAGTGTLVEGQGATIYNLTISENSFSDVNTASGTSAALLTKVSASVTAQFNVDFVDNTVNQSTQGDFRFEQRGTGPFRLEGSASSVQEQVESTNTGALTTSGTITQVTPGIFDETVPLLLGDLVWNDEDGNGIQAGSEPGLAGVRMTLTGTESSSGLAVQRMTISDRDGGYQFSSLLPGNYSVRVEPFAGFTLAAVGQGGDTSSDNNFSRQGRSASVTMTAETDNFDLDAGLIRNWQNPVLPVDVNNDTIVAPNDALLIINDLNANGARPLSLPPVAPNEPPPYLDVNGDTLIAPVDVLQVINALNGGGGGEGEARFLTELSPAPSRAAPAQVPAGPPALLPPDTWPTPERALARPIPSESHTAALDFPTLTRRPTNPAQWQPTNPAKWQPAVPAQRHLAVGVTATMGELASRQATQRDELDPGWDRLLTLLANDHVRRETGPRILPTSFR